MFVWQRTIVDNAGNILPGATVEVRSAEGLHLAELFSTRAGAPLTNPFNADSDGFARLYVEIPGRYHITASSGGFEREWENVELGFVLQSLPDLGPLVDQLIQEAIDAWEPEQPEMPVEIYRGWVHANGAVESLPEGWSVSKLATGEYQITHNLDLASFQLLSVVATRIGAWGVPGGASALTPGSDQTVLAITHTTADSFRVRVLAADNAVALDQAFFFVAVRDKP